MKRIVFFAMSCIAIFSKNAVAQCNVTGILSIGATGNYQTLSAAAIALRLNGPSGNLVLELQPSYTSSGETFPINFSGIGCMSAASTITIRPQATATNLTIATANQYTFDLQKTRYLIIDGRPGGVGAGIGLTISNTHDKGAAVKFVNGASNNILRYLNISGAASTMLPAAVTTYDTTAVINFFASAAASCDSNQIDHCNIFDAGSATPATLVHAAGVSSKVNKYNAVTNCNLYNFYQVSANSYGINLEEYNSNWVISNNNFYQTASRAYILSTYTPHVYGIKIKTSFYNDFLISGNYFGGSMARSQGVMMNMAGNLVFDAVSVNSAYLPGHPTLIRNNVISNIAMSPNNNLGWFNCISMGTFFGHCTGNMIGSTTAVDNLIFSPTGSSATFSGIGSTITTTLEPDSIKANIISGVTLTGSNPSFVGISAGGARNIVVDSNVVGYPSLSNSIVNNSSGTSYGVRIVNYSSSGKLIISNNNISNIIAASSYGSVAGIYSEGTASGRYIIEKNTISNLSAASTVNSSTTPAVTAMLLNIAGTPAMRISRNTIYNLSATSLTAGNYITGIYYAGPAAGADSIHSNIISAFKAPSTGNLNLQGIQLQSGNSSVANNVIRLGLDADAGSVGWDCNISGINEVAGLNTVVHNSVYIGGATTSSTSATSYAFRSAVSTGTRVIANNIFYNARSSSTGKNCCIALAGGTPDAGLFLDYNIYFKDGSNGVTGRLNSIDYSTITAWKAAVQKDNNSNFVNPSFLGIGNPLASMNYHLAATNAAEGKGTAAYTVNTDIDEETRSLLTPVDIGADAGNFTYNGTDGIILSGDILVGSGQQFTSLTGIGGLFDAVNTYGLTGNSTIKITTDLIETGEVPLDSAGTKGYQLIIQPAAASVKRIANSTALAQSMIRLQYTRSQVTVDGSFNGSGNYLQFTSFGFNSNTSPVELLPNTHNVTIKNCSFETAGYSTAYTIFVQGENRNIVIEKNRFKLVRNSDFPDAYLLSNLYCGAGFSGSIAQNYFTDANHVPVVLAPGGTDTVIISGNHFYQEGTFTGHVLLQAGSEGIITITGNYFGGTAPFCGGTAFTTANSFTAVEARNNANSKAVISIQNNTINNIHVVNDPNNSERMFSGIRVQGVDTLLVGNLQKNSIGSIENSNSIRAEMSGNVYTVEGIQYASCKYVRVYNNEIGGISLTASGQGLASIAGISSQLADYGATAYNLDVLVQNNIIKNNAIAGTLLSSYNYGIAINTGDPLLKTVVANNIISDLTSASSELEEAYEVGGIAMLYARGNLSNTVIEKNRVFNLKNATEGGLIVGVKIYDAAQKVQVNNNQFSLINRGNTNAARIVGIYDDLTCNTYFEQGIVPSHAFYYNSIYVGGNSTGADTSMGLYVADDHISPGNATIAAFKNNLIYNERSNSGSGRQLAVQLNIANQSQQWAPGASDNNLFIVEDTANLVSGYDAATGISMNFFRQAMGTDRDSYAASAVSVPASLLFINKDSADLSINATNAFCWYVNGKGYPVNEVAVDFSGNARSVTVAGGATDIGAQEFATNTLPPALEATGDHQPGGTETFTWAANRVATINWYADGNLPDLGSVRWFTGEWPKDNTNNGTLAPARSMNQYLQVPVTGGNNYVYDIALDYKQSMIGKISEPGTMILNKRIINTLGSWVKIIPTIADTAARTLTANGLISFSEFAATDIAAPLSGALESCSVNYWTANVSNVWEDAANWSCGAVPGSNSSVFVNSGTVILNSNATIGSLTVGPGVIVTVNAPYNLLILH